MNGPRRASSINQRTINPYKKPGNERDTYKGPDRITEVKNSNEVVSTKRAGTQQQVTTREATHKHEKKKRREPLFSHLLENGAKTLGFPGIMRKKPVEGNT